MKVICRTWLEKIFDDSLTKEESLEKLITMIQVVFWIAFSAGFAACAVLVISTYPLLMLIPVLLWMSAFMRIGWSNNSETQKEAEGE